MTASTTIRASRSLLFPGTQPPLSHFGATLARHAVTTGLRYTAHQLGQSLFDTSPATIVKLRLYLDRARIVETLSGDAGGVIATALLEPEGAGAGPIPPTLRGALAFHRARLKMARPPAAASREPIATADPQRLWERFSNGLSALLPKLNDAFLSETIGALDRRRQRGAGSDIEPCQSRFAARFLAGSSTRLDALGAPDLRAPSWAETSDAPGAGRGFASGVRECRMRGRFREWYRIALGHLQPIYRAYAESAAERGLIADPDDAFFFPFGLGHSLTGATAPSWLAPAVASNRAEFDATWASPNLPPERLAVGASPLARLGARPEWSRAPLELLP